MRDLQVLTLDRFAGLYTGGGSEVPTNSLSELKNCEIDETGRIVQRRGFTRIGADPLGGHANAVTGLWRFRKASGWRQFLGTCYDALFKCTNEGAGTWEAIPGATIEVDAQVGFAQYGDTLYFSGPTVGPFRYDGVAVYPAGLPAPTDGPGISGSSFGNGSLTAGKHKWKMTYVYGIYGESEGGPESITYTATGDDAKRLTVPTSVRGDVTAIRLYRTDKFTNDDDPEAFIFYRVLDLWTDVISEVSYGDEIKVTGGVPERTSVADHINDDDLGGEMQGDKGMPPAGSILTVWNERLWVAGSAAYPERLWFSDIGTDGIPRPDVFVDGYFKDVTSKYGDAITGLHAVPGALLVVKRNSIWTLTGEGVDTYSLRQGQDGVGCVAPRSLATYRGGVIFLGADGVYSFDGVSAQRLSKAIEDVFKGLEESVVRVAAGVVYGHRYFLSYPSGATPVNDSYVCLDLDTGRWSRGDALAASCFCVWTTEGDRRYMWFGHASNGHVYLADLGVYDDVTDEIVSEVATQDLDMGVEDRYKEFRRAWIDAEALDPLTVSWELDGILASGTAQVLGDDVGDDWDDFDWDDGYWGGAMAGVTTFRFPPGTVGRKLKLKIGHTGQVAPWKVSSLRIGFKVKERWRGL